MSPPRGLEVADRSRTTTATTRRELVVAEAFLAVAVEIRIAAVSRLLGRRDERIADRQRLHVGETQPPARAVHVVRAAPLGLGFAAIGQHVVIRPAHTDKLAPAVAL